MTEPTEPQRRQPLLVSRRVEFWVAFLAVALAVLVFLLPGILQRRAAAQTLSALQPLVASDTRFAKVMVSSSTNYRVSLTGSVDTEADLTALRQLVERANVSKKVTIRVTAGAPPR
jgi:hypothetical protein